MQKAEIVEAMARAIYESRTEELASPPAWDGPVLDAKHPSMRRRYRDHATAALSALCASIPGGEAALLALVKGEAVVVPVPRCGDNVWHRPSGETWVVAYADAAQNELCAAGWPDTTAKLSDCALVMRCDDETHVRAVEGWRLHGKSDRRAARVMEIYGAATPYAAKREGRDG